MHPRYLLILILCTLSAFIIGMFLGCGDDDSPTDSHPTVPQAICEKPAHVRVDAHTPQSMVADWGQPVRIGEPINTPCPADAIEISGDGQYLYFMFTEDVLDSMTPAQILARKNNTYRAQRIGGPGDFDAPVYYNLAHTTEYSLDGEISFTSDGGRVYFHSNREENTGNQQNPSVTDILDIYTAPIVDGQPGVEVNLGSPVNSEYADGEHSIHPNDTTLYFSSGRPGGFGSADIYRSVLSGGVWSNPVNLGFPTNTFASDYQPTFTADGDTMYFASDRNLFTGMSIYRSVRNGDTWTAPQVVITGIVGEPSLTDDGEYLYFVHVLSDTLGTFDADIWYSQRVHK